MARRTGSMCVVAMLLAIAAFTTINQSRLRQLPVMRSCIMSVSWCFSSTALLWVAQLLEHILCGVAFVMLVSHWNGIESRRLKKIVEATRQFEIEKLHAQLYNRDTEVLCLEQDLDETCARLDDLLLDPNVQAVLAARPLAHKLGLNQQRRAEVQPIVAILQDKLVCAALSDVSSPVKVVTAVDVIRQHLLNNTRTLDAVFRMPALGLRSDLAFFDGRQWIYSDAIKATSVALALVAACDRPTRRLLLSQVVPWCRHAQNWQELNYQLFHSEEWRPEQYRSSLGGQPDHVLLYTLDSCMGDHVGTMKAERVAAIMILGQLVKEGLME